jgi:integrase
MPCVFVSLVNNEKRHRALLGVLVACALRRGELSRMNCEHLVMRAGRWVFLDFLGKGNKTRSVAVPLWVIRCRPHQALYNSAAPCHVFPQKQAILRLPRTWACFADSLSPRLHFRYRPSPHDSDGN